MSCEKFSEVMVFSKYTTRQAILEVMACKGLHKDQITTLKSCSLSNQLTTLSEKLGEEDLRVEYSRRD